MVTYKILLLDHQWKADGSNYYRVRVTHNRESKFMKTNIVVTKDDVTKTGKVKTNSILSAVQDMHRKMLSAINQLDTFEVKSMSVSEVIEKIESILSAPEKFTLDFVDFAMKVASKKAPGTVSGYSVAMNALLRFFNGKRPDISDITVRNLRAFADYIASENVVQVNWRKGESRQLEKKKGGRAVSLYLSTVRYVYREAMKEFNEPDKGLFRIPVDVFSYYQIPKGVAPKHRNIPCDVIQLMIDTRKELRNRTRMAVDAFLISFGLCGMNAADLYECSRPEKDDILHYQRCKTRTRRDDGAEMYVKIHPVIKEIMKDYKDSERCFDYYKRYSNRDTFLSALSNGLKSWATKYKQAEFTFYAARHSWATIGRSKACNIEKSIITAGLCHVGVGNRNDDIYINFDWEILWNAQKTILDIFKWE